MASLRRGLVDKVKKAATQVAAKAGTRGARAIVETTAAAVKTVDKLQAKLGRGPRKARPSRQAPAPIARVTSPTPAAKETAKETAAPAAKPRRAAPASASVAPPVAPREAGRKTMPAASAKRSKPAQKQFKVKRGQKHPHTGR